MISIQKFGSIFWIGFATSKRPHLHKAYVVRVCILFWPTVDNHNTLFMWLELLERSWLSTKFFASKIWNFDENKFCTTKKLRTSSIQIQLKNNHSRFSQDPSLKKLLQQRFWYFSIPNDRKRSWENFEGMFPKLFLRYLHKSEKNGKNNQISYFYFGFWFKIELFEGWYL